MCRVRTTGPLHAPKLLCSMIWTVHQNGTPSEARRPRLVHIYSNGGKIASYDYKPVSLQTNGIILDGIIWIRQV